MASDKKARDVEPGDVIQLPGGAYTVTKVRARGKSVAITISGAKGIFTREHPRKERLTVLDSRDAARVALEAREAKRAARPPAKRPAARGADIPLHDPNGAQNRWATAQEATATAPPYVAAGSPWGEPVGEAEKALEGILGARLVGESTTSEGYYVPPVGPDTIAAHLYIFHDVTPDAVDWATLAALHDDMHARALVDPHTTLKVNHWHTERRPN